MACIYMYIQLIQFLQIKICENKTVFGLLCSKHHITVFPAIETTVNFQRFQITFLFLFSNQMVFRAGTHKMQARIANREDPDQTAPSEAV